ncbi:leucine rich adaptor protein 1-like [Erpetoichthys calabaricus]|uniref:leucine rich adaptor protein 1-like n=1 Tax=Erpetoichthys calabaricus TaxID=27687 RepID=UPI00109FC9EF|nr:leucine rich adaptor protein 1-like [Erpetoichthys calabaricus]
MDDRALPDLKDIETKLGRKVPESLARSLKEERLAETREERSGRSNTASSRLDCSALERLKSKMNLLKREMAHLRAIDIRLMHQLLSINEGIESIKWMIEEKGAIASRDGSLAGSLSSLSESQSTSPRGSYSSLQDGSDGLDGISVGSYLDTLADDVPGHTSPLDMERFSEGSLIDEPLYKDAKLECEDYFCFG